MEEWRRVHIVTTQSLCAMSMARWQSMSLQINPENRRSRWFQNLKNFSIKECSVTALCKSRDCPAWFFRAEKTVKQALLTLYAKNATEQQGSVRGHPANANIAEMQFQAAIPDKCKIQKKGDAKLYRKILTQTKKSEVRIILLCNPIHSCKFCRGM